MSWLDDIAKRLPQTTIQIVNDAKSPSGKPHVGSLRGIILHDAVYKFLKKEKNIPVRYIYGSDDYDPLDELPAGYGDAYKKYLGMPLCNVPSPPNSKENSLAMHFIADFFKIFDELGIKAEKYYMHKVYRSGTFDEAIDKILNQVEKIREIYLKISHSQRSENWYPFQVICEQCGKLGTTEVVNYDGKEVTYHCRKDLVTWATGCGHSNKMSPFGGNGKLPYKVEWAAKWAYMNITIEGGGTDHNTKGGSRDVANACIRQIFGERPPVNIPYGFFMLGGKKMSSSKGLGASARGMTDFLPPEILRFLMLGTQPKREVNFEPSEKYITKLFNDFDKLHYKHLHSSEVSEYEKIIYNLSQIFSNTDYYTAEFPLIITLLQLPHINITKAIEERKGSKLSEIEKDNLERRINAAHYWLENMASDDDKLKLQDELPKRANDFTIEQRTFLNNLAAELSKCKWEENELQSAIFTAARTTPIMQKEAFKAFYISLLDKEQGPKAGNLLCCIDKDFLTKRFIQLKYNIEELWKATNWNQEKFDKWINDNREKIMKLKAKILTHKNKYGVIEIKITLKDDKVHIKRLNFSENISIDFISISEKYLNKYKNLIS